MSRCSMGDPDYVYQPQSAETTRLRRSLMLDYHDRKKGYDIPIVPRLSYRAQIKANRAKINAVVNGPDAIWNKGLYIPKPKLIVTPSVVLAYPYIIKKREEHADLLAVNSLVPRGLPGREDVCQEIMLALWENRITLDELKSRRDDVRGFVRQFKRDNMEASGYAISLDQPMYDGRSWHDVLVDPATVLGHSVEYEG